MGRVAFRIAAGRCIRWTCPQRSSSRTTRATSGKWWGDGRERWWGVGGALWGVSDGGDGAFVGRCKWGVPPRGFNFRVKTLPTGGRQLTASDAVPVSAAPKPPAPPSAYEPPSEASSTYRPKSPPPPLAQVQSLLVLLRVAINPLLMLVWLIPMWSATSSRMALTGR